AKEQIETQFRNLPLPPHFDLDLALTDNVMFDFQSHRQVMGATSLAVIIEDFEHEITSEKDVTVMIAHDKAAPFPLRLLEAAGDDDLEARFEDVHPEISESLRLRLTNWCGRLLGRLLQDFEAQSRTP
ncbi:MAG TPA: hypothetical protein VEG34_17465, partial [Thermoanaerobaculia bacterium]|nr:hypothetical protein [Thermoanaerobaculia bacterium]